MLHYLCYGRDPLGKVCCTQSYTDVTYLIVYTQVYYAIIPYVILYIYNLW